MARKRLFTEEILAFMRSVAKGRLHEEITDLVNAEFGKELKVNQVKSAMKNYSIVTGARRKVRPKNQIWTDDMREFVIENYEGLTTSKLQKLVNEKFNLNLTNQQVRAFKQRQRLASGVNTQFGEGHVPANKGTVGIYNVGGNATSFKKGVRAANYLPIGTERLSADGYWRVKVQDEGAWDERWRIKHRIDWEAVNGLIPAGHRLLFIDNDRSNCQLDNLRLVTDRQNSTLNRYGLRTGEPASIESALVLADYIGAVNDKKPKRKRKRCQINGKKVKFSVDSR